MCVCVCVCFSFFVSGYLIKMWTGQGFILSLTKKIYTFDFASVLSCCRG